MYTNLTIFLYFWNQSCQILRVLPLIKNLRIGELRQMGFRFQVQPLPSPPLKGRGGMSMVIYAGASTVLTLIFCLNFNYGFSVPNGMIFTPSVRV